MSACQGWSRHWQGRRLLVQRQAIITQQCRLRWGSSPPLGVGALALWEAGPRRGTAAAGH